jgi:hypothetical protein
VTLSVRNVAQTDLYVAPVAIGDIWLAQSWRHAQTFVISTW